MVIWDFFSSSCMLMNATLPCHTSQKNGNGCTPPHKIQKTYDGTDKKFSQFARKNLLTDCKTNL